MKENQVALFFIPKSTSSFSRELNGLLLTTDQIRRRDGRLDHDLQGISGEKDSFPTTTYSRYLGCGWCIKKNDQIRNKKNKKIKKMKTKIKIN